MTKKKNAQNVIWRNERRRTKKQKKRCCGNILNGSEGFDCKYPLDSIILTSPKSNIEQAVGRILRQEVKDRKFVPLVIDISDSFCSIFASQGKKRIKFYEKNKYNISMFDSNNNSIEYVSESERKKKRNKKKILNFFLMTNNFIINLIISNNIY